MQPVAHTKRKTKDEGRIDPSFVLRLSSALQSSRARLAALDDGNTTGSALLGHVLGLTRAQVLARPEQVLTPEQAAAFEALVARAAAGEPLAYLTGRREFYGLDFEVDPAVLVPRPETELLVDRALAAQPARVLDVGTGSGCIAVTLAVRLPEAALTASDLSPAALALARRNAQRHGVAEHITFVHSDLLDAFLPPASSFQPPFDLIAANLPYIDTDELGTLPVARFEPRLALDGGPGGLVLVARLLRQAPALLAPGGRLLLEIGASQGPAALDLAHAAFPSAAAHVQRDLAGLDRLLVIETHRA
jgi:release factor glutamine methyltransferase